MASKRFPALYMGNFPHSDIISASASAPLSEEFGGAVRDCVRSPEYQKLFPGVRLKEDTTAKGRWSTEDGGSYFSVGIGGDLFGKGGELGLIDDPFGSWEDAQSELKRKRVYDWYTGTFYNRIRPGAPIVVIQHRMHEADLVGMLLAAEKHGADRWKVISVPAELDNPPWAERYDMAALERIKANSFPRKWAALYMQDPTPEDGEYFKRDKFKRYNDSPRDVNVYMSGDFAVTENDGDYTEIAVWGVDPYDRVYALDWWRGRKTADIWIDKLLDFAKQYNPIRFVGEMGPIRRAIEPLLELRMRDRGVFVSPEWLPHTSDKKANATSFQGLVEMGRVYFPNTDWAEDVISQLLKFPGGRHDDAVDTCSLMGRHISSMWAARSEPAPMRLEDAWNTAGIMLAKDMFRPMKKAS